MGRRGTHEIGDDMTQTPFHWDCPKRGVERQKQHQHQMHRITFAFSHTNGSHDYEQDCLSVIHYLFNNNNNLKTLRYIQLLSCFLPILFREHFLMAIFSNYMISLYFLCSSGTLCNLRGPQQHWWRLLNIFNGNNDHHRCCPISFSSREVASKASELQTWRVEMNLFNKT